LPNDVCACGKYIPYHASDCMVRTLEETGTVVYELPGKPHKDLKLVVAWIQLTNKLVAKKYIDRYIDRDYYGTLDVLEDMIDIARYDGRQNRRRVSDTVSEVRAMIQDIEPEYLRKITNEGFENQLDIANGLIERNRKAVDKAAKDKVKEEIVTRAKAAAKEAYRKVLEEQGVEDEDS